MFTFKSEASLQMRASQQAQAKAHRWPVFDDYSELYWESTRETLVGLYGRRDSQTGQPTESLNDIIHRVSFAIAVAELKYALELQEIIALELDDAISHPSVRLWAKTFADCIGRQRFWANTPANINACPEISLSVLKYWAHGVLAGMAEDEIWLRSDELRARAVQVDGAGADDLRGETGGKQDHELAMGRLAAGLKGKGCLAACGVAYVHDSLEGIQDTAKTEAMAAKAAMGMGLNTSTLRPWSSVLPSGAAASGPDRFYEKSIAKAVEAVAQGGRRGGALIELRNSDHPDILIFIEKKRLIPRPGLAPIFKELRATRKQHQGESALDYKKRLILEAEHKFGQEYAEFISRQNYLKNTNITVLAMPGFMEAVKEGLFYPARFDGKDWGGPIFDPRKPVLDEQTGQPRIDRLTKELVYEEYSVDLAAYPQAAEAARKMKNTRVELSDTTVRVPGHFYAPDVFQRIVEGMRSSGEPGIAFYNHVNAANANDHVYDLDTCNPCGEQFLPAGPGFDGRFYLGTCNLSSMHAAHKDLFRPDGSYDTSRMAETAAIMQRFMDNISDVSWYPLPEQNMTTRMERRNGGGFAGVAEYLSRLWLEFGSPEALSAVEELYREFTKASLDASLKLAAERGVYPLWEGSRFARRGLAVRNSCMTNNAPTGTLAQALQTSWGVDPHNGIVFSRKVRSRHVNFVAPGFREAMEKHGAWPASEAGQHELAQAIRDNNKSCRGLQLVPPAVQRAFPIRVEVEPAAYIKHLAAIHRGASLCPEAFNSVSNTCSIPMDMPDHLIGEAVFLAYELGVKDVTFYPDGSRLSQPVEQIAAGFRNTEADDLLSLIGHQEQREVCTEETSGISFKVKVGSPGGGSTLHVSLNHEVGRPGELIEIYARMGKPGAIESGLFEAVGRLSSSFLQYAGQFGETERKKAEETVVQQLINIQSGYPVHFKFPDANKPTVIQSPCDGLAKAILEYRNSFQKTAPHVHISAASAEVPTLAEDGDGNGSAPCQACGYSDWLRVDGCWVCQSCGYSKCG